MSAWWIYLWTWITLLGFISLMENNQSFSVIGWSDIHYFCTERLLKSDHTQFLHGMPGLKSHCYRVPLQWTFLGNSSISVPGNFLSCFRFILALEKISASCLCKITGYQTKISVLPSLKFPLLRLNYNHLAMLHRPHFSQDQYQTSKTHNLSYILSAWKKLPDKLRGFKEVLEASLKKCNTPNDSWKSLVHYCSKLKTIQDDINYISSMYQETIEALCKWWKE